MKEKIVQLMSFPEGTINRPAIVALTSEGRIFALNFSLDGQQWGIVPCPIEKFPMKKEETPPGSSPK